MSVNKVYDIVKDSVSDGFSFLEIIHLIGVAMKEVGKIKRMDGSGRKQLVKDIVIKVIEEKAKSADKEKAIAIVNDIGDEVIEGMYWAGKQSKKIFRKAKSVCGCV